jgi:hypothetical protein
MRLTRHEPEDLIKLLEKENDALLKELPDLRGRYPNMLGDSK